MARGSLLVVGAGINGLWTAWRFLREGWAVTLVEAGALPNPHGSSWDQHRLIHPFGARSEAELDAIDASLGAWDQLWQWLGRSHYRPTGGLLGSRCDEQAALLDAAGWPCGTAGATWVAGQLPGLHQPAGQLILWSDRAGILLADRIVADMVRLLASHGCMIRGGRRIAPDELLAGRIRIAGEWLEPDRIVVAAGTDTGALLPGLAPHLTVAEQTMFYFAASQHWGRAPLLVDFGPQGDLWMAPCAAGTSLKFAATGLAVAHPPFDAEALARRIAAVFPTAQWRFRRERRCRYARTADGAPIVAPLDGTGGRVWIVAGCNGGGFKLAPHIAGRIWRAAHVDSVCAA